MFLLSTLGAPRRQGDSVSKAALHQRWADPRALHESATCEPWCEERYAEFPKKALEHCSTRSARGHALCSGCSFCSEERLQGRGGQQHAADCVKCTDKATAYMVSQGESCRGHLDSYPAAKAEDHCENWFAEDGYCQQSCFDAGHGYAVCCLIGEQELGWQWPWNNTDEEEEEQQSKQEQKQQQQQKQQPPPTVDMLIDGKVVKGTEGTLQLIHVGKAGGLSVSSWLKEAGVLHYQYHVGDIGGHAGPPTKSDVEQHKRWAIVVRDPITRLQSAFDYENPNNPQPPGWVKQELLNDGFSARWLRSFYKGAQTPSGCFASFGAFVDALGRATACGDWASRTLFDPNSGSQHFAKGINFYVGTRPPAATSLWRRDKGGLSKPAWEESTAEIASLLRRKGVYVLHMEALADDLAALSGWLGGRPIHAGPVTEEHQRGEHEQLSSPQVSRLRQALKREYELLEALGVQSYGKGRPLAVN
jgi:hypothetical protein